ncbi:MAG TPA: 4-alpha-glucanotransferase [Bradyrhizobium sp.]|nr:4-alpha-glucanotransferase [Bradyrhizobium sp.]
MDIYKKAQSLGVLTEYIDGQGRQRVTDAAALEVILGALPPSASRRLMDGPAVVRTGLPPSCALSETAALPVAWKILAGAVVIAEGKTEAPSIAFPEGLALGTYRLHLTDAAGTTEEVPLVVAPEQAFGGNFDRCWLLAVQLYGVRSPRNWGIGDFTDLEGLLRLANSLGADGVGLNPLHALFDDRPGDCSPYSPNSRLFLNPLYIDVEKLPELPPDTVARNRETMSRLRALDVVDYVGVAELKWTALRQAFANFIANPALERRRDFEAFRKEQGTLLSRFACFEALRHRLGKPWWEWPEQWQRPDDARCAELRAGEDAREIEFVEFVQWTAGRQLLGCKQLATRLGMKVGLYLDVAVGVQSDGFDAWNEQEAISRLLGVGAPPDLLNTLGQDWGLAGFNAAGLERRSFEPFREMLRASMRYAGAIRLDHVLGLKRLYLVPRGFRADNGAYVLMPFEALLAATALESAAHACVVIGEDLGTVPPGFRERMNGWGIWSYQVMMFERDDAGKFHMLDHYPANALITFNTHDLCTYAGWRSFADLKLKRALGIDPGESDEARWQALGALDDVLRDSGIEGHTVYSVASFLARTKSRLLAISLEDLLGVIDQPNIPGTVNEHPNWRQRVPVAIDQIASAIDVEALKSATAERIKH